MKKTLILFFTIVSILAAGCGTKAPDGFPKTYNTTVKVTLGDKPLQNASISFYPDAGAHRWSVAGRTDANGNAIMTTFQGDYKAKGVPEGTYKVTFAKEPIYPDWNEEKIEVKTVSDAMAARAQSGRKRKAAVNEIPVSLADVKQSGTVVEVTSKGGTFQYEINDLLADMKPVANKKK